VDKGIAPAKYMPPVGQAPARAAKLEELHLRNDTRFPNDHPSSGLHRACIV